MAHTIIHHKGVFNLYSSISDSPVFESGLTEEQLNQYTASQYGLNGLKTLPDRIKRAQLKGTSSHLAMSLESEIMCNRAGPKESQLPLDVFIAQYLTLKDQNENP